MLASFAAMGKGIVAPAPMPVNLSADPHQGAVASARSELMRALLRRTLCDPVALEANARAAESRKTRATPIFLPPCSHSGVVRNVQKGSSHRYGPLVRRRSRTHAEIVH
jgi:hypothetical protein